MLIGAITDTFTANTDQFERSMATARLTISATFKNQKALRALRKVTEVLEDVAEDFGYRDDVKQAVKAARYAARHIGVEVRPRG